jgi:hypothetical protein
MEKAKCAGSKKSGRNEERRKAKAARAQTLATSGLKFRLQELGFSFAGARICQQQPTSASLPRFACQHVPHAICNGQNSPLRSARGFEQR